MTAALQPDADPPAQTFFGGFASLIALPRMADERGTLVPFEFADLPFTPRRAFVVRDVPPGARRGRHRHKRGQHLLVCLAGRIDVVLRYRGETERVSLFPDNHGLLIRNEVWSEQTYVLPDSILLALASDPYDPDAYIGDPIDDP